MLSHDRHPCDGGGRTLDSRAIVTNPAPRLVLPAALRWAALGALAAAILIYSVSALGSRSKTPRFDVQLIPMKEPARSETTTATEPIPAARASMPVLFSVTIPTHLANAPLETRVLNAKGDLVWVGVGLRRNESQGTGQILFPAGFLGPGEYRLAIGRATPGADRAEFPFRLE